MLDLKFIRKNPDLIKKVIEKKHVDLDFGKFLELDQKRSFLLKEKEELSAKKNRLEREFRQDKQKKELLEKMKEIDKKYGQINEEFKKIEREWEYLYSLIPNIPLETVPEGKDESENVVLREVGEKPRFDFEPKSYFEIAQKLDIIDTQRSAKISGTRFCFLKKTAVLLQMAIVNFVFDFLKKEGFTPLVVPVMVKPEMIWAMGYINKTKENDNLWQDPETFFLRDDPLALVATAEQSIGPMHADEIFHQEDLPKRYFALSSCFRREAGSYGKDTKGILRVHQFDKIEMFSFQTQEESVKEHLYFLSLEEKMMQALKIPYRVLNICVGDLGLPAAAKYDIEAWFPAEGRYRETHSTSNCTDFQARRLKIRYRTKNNEIKYVHTINGTAFAIGRIIAAIIENYQNKQGTFEIPQVLKDYF